MITIIRHHFEEMGETRDRGVKATEEGIQKLKTAQASQRNAEGKRWTLRDVAIESGVDERTVGRFLRQESNVDEGTARAICQALNVDIVEIVDFQVLSVEEDRSGKTETDSTIAQGRIGQIGNNPFIYGDPVPPDKFYGRHREILEVRSRISTAQSINIVGLRRNGKTSLLRYIQAYPEKFFQPDRSPLIIRLDLQDGRFHSPNGITEGLRREIQRQQGKAPWAADENVDAWAVQDGLEALCDRNIPLVIMLDEFEAIASRLEQFQGWGEDWRSKASTQGLFTLVIASKRPISEIYQELRLTSPFGNIFSTTILGALEQQAWHRLVQDGFAASGSSADDLGWIDRLAGGLPYYVQLAAAMLWQEEDEVRAKRAFEFQAKPRFKELWQNLNAAEQLALRFSAGTPEQLPPEPALIEMLQRYGLLRESGQVFSSAFAAFVLEQP